MILLTGSTRFDPEELILNQFPYIFIRRRHAHHAYAHAYLHTFIYILIVSFT